MNAAGQLCITTAAGQPSTISCRTAQYNKLPDSKRTTSCRTANLRLRVSHHHNTTSCRTAKPIGCWPVIVAIQRHRQQELQDSLPTHATLPAFTRRSYNTITPTRTDRRENTFATTASSGLESEQCATASYRDYMVFLSFV